MYIRNCKVEKVYMSWFVLPIYLPEFQGNQSKSMPSGQLVTGLREPLIACRSKISTVCNLLDAGGFCTTDSSEMQNTLLIILTHFACQLMIHKVLFAIHLKVSMHFSDKH